MKTATDAELEKLARQEVKEFLIDSGIRLEEDGFYGESDSDSLQLTLKDLADFYISGYRAKEASLSGQQGKPDCSHNEIEDTGVGYYKCLLCGEHIRHDLWHKIKNTELFEGKEGGVKQPIESEDELWNWVAIIGKLSIKTLSTLKKQFTIKRR